MSNSQDHTFSQKTSFLIMGAIAVPIFGFVVLTSYFPNTWDSLVSRLPQRVEEEKEAIATPTPQAQTPTCVPAVGRLFAEVKLYQEGCQEYVATVYGGNSKEIVVYRPDDTAKAWIDRDLALKMWVMSDDPGIKAMTWRDF